MSNIILRPFRLIPKEDIYKYTQHQHDILIHNYEKIYMLERQIEELKLNHNNELLTLQLELDNYNIKQNAILDFINL